MTWWQEMRWDDMTRHGDITWHKIRWGVGLWIYMLSYICCAKCWDIGVELYVELYAKPMLYDWLPRKCKTTWDINQSILRHWKHLHENQCFTIDYPEPAPGRFFAKKKYPRYNRDSLYNHYDFWSPKKALLQSPPPEPPYINTHVSVSPACMYVCM